MGGERGVLSVHRALFGQADVGTGKTFEKKRTENDAKKCGRTGLSAWGLEISLFCHRQPFSHRSCRTIGGIFTTRRNLITNILCEKLKKWKDFHITRLCH